MRITRIICCLFAFWADLLGPDTRLNHLRKAISAFGRKKSPTCYFAGPVIILTQVLRSLW
jgi:hypothetical protein